MSESEASSDKQRKKSPKVRDDEASNQQARLRHLRQAWQEAVDRRTEAMDSSLFGDANREARLQYYRAGVEQFLMQLVSLADRTEATEYWSEEGLGEVVIPVPEEIREAMSGTHTRVAWGAEPPEPRRIAVVGLTDFMERDWPVSHEFTLPVGQAEEIRATESAEAPMALLDKTLTTALRFMGATGLDVELTAEMNEDPNPI